MISISISHERKTPESLEAEKNLRKVLDEYNPLMLTGNIRLVSDGPSRAHEDSIDINIRTGAPKELLKTFIHEQMHLFTQRHARYDEAIAFLKENYEGNGECNKSGTYPNSFWEHIIVCWNTRNILRQLLGESEADSIYEDFWVAYPKTEEMVKSDFQTLQKHMEELSLVYK